MAELIVASDEELHLPGAEPHWQESYYFNWVDLEGKALGFARIGYRFAARQADAVVIMMRDGRRELVYGAVNERIEGDPMALRSTDGLTVGRLTFRLDEPLQQWRIELAGNDQVSLTWSASAPAFDFGHNGTEVIAHRHFEHPGVVTGWQRIGGRVRQINGFGTRDKSWGPRDWGNIEGWDWISAQFGEDLAFTATQTTNAGTLTQSGFVSSGGKCIGIASFELRYIPGDEHTARDAEMSIHAEDGTTYHVVSRGKAQLPLFKAGLMLQETHATFEAFVEGGPSLNGAGVVEHTWHVGTSGLITRLPQLLPVLKDALVSRFR